MNTYTKMGRGMQFVAAAFRRATALTKPTPFVPHKKVAGERRFSVDFRAALKGGLKRSMPCAAFTRQRCDGLHPHHYVQLRKCSQNVPGIGFAAGLCGSGDHYRRQRLE